ncbi:MAG TPA: DUF4157 domain-containing protein [Polyangia bacterium]|nr:DUF4157 domain-containing protein [Polyangia bacterium]
MLAGRLRTPRPRSRALPVRLARALWTLPTNLLGHLAGLVASGRLPRRVGGPAAVGWLYPIRPGRGLDWVGAVTIGHAILYSRGLLDGPTAAARLTLAHELAHTRQHDRLGPLYLPLHILSQAASALLTRGRPIAVSRVHDLNLLEQTFITVPASAPRAPGASDEEVARLLAAFGV